MLRLANKPPLLLLLLFIELAELQLNHASKISKGLQNGAENVKELLTMRVQFE